MKEQLSLLRLKLITNGYVFQEGLARQRSYHSDPTLHPLALDAYQVRFDLKEGFPSLPASVNLKEALADILFQIGGQTNVKWMHAYDLHHRDEESLQPKHLEGFFDRMVELGLATPEQKAFQMSTVPEESLGELGPVGGFTWRHWPLCNKQLPALAIDLTVEQLPSDFVAALKAIHDTIPTDHEEYMPFETFAVRHYYSAIDQLGAVTRTLARQHSREDQLVITHNPEYNPIDALYGLENVIMNRAPQLSTVYAFQTYVWYDAMSEPCLNLKVDVRALDARSLPKLTAEYGLLLLLLAHTANLKPARLTFSINILAGLLPEIEALIAAPYVRPEIEFSPTLTRDLYQIKLDDVIIRTTEES